MRCTDRRSLEERSGGESLGGRWLDLCVYAQSSDAAGLPSGCRIAKAALLRGSFAGGRSRRASLGEATRYPSSGAHRGDRFWRGSAGTSHRQLAGSNRIQRNPSKISHEDPAGYKAARKR